MLVDLPVMDKGMMALLQSQITWFALGPEIQSPGQDANLTKLS